MVETKRQQLERFLSEQIIGPGVSGYRFVNIRDEELLSENLSEREPIGYSKELINIVPAGVYSTGILFPIDKSKSNNDECLTNHFDKEVVVEEDGNTTIEKEQDEDSIDDEETIYIDQMFPNSMGITCCFDGEIQNWNSATIKVKARYYSKVDHKLPNFNQDYGVL